MTLIKSLKLSGILSFPLDSEPIALAPLNVLIGPNGSGKSNLIEAIELLHATPTALAAAIRDGGGVQEWMWKGSQTGEPATIEAVIAGGATVNGGPPIRDLRYRLAFAPVGQRTEAVDEVIEESQKRSDTEQDVNFFYRFQSGRPVLNVHETTGVYRQRTLRREDLVLDESVLSQRKGSDVYPELTWLGQQFSRIQTFREWSFGRYVALQQPQPADLPTDVLLPDARNLGLLLNDLEHSQTYREFNRLLTRFLPRYQRFSTRVHGGTVQFYLHESGLESPIPATRLSDGTIRFIAILALLLSPAPAPLICLEEPELGLHPDAIALLSDLLIDAAARMQLIVTTHSDVLVSGLSEQPESVMVCEHQGGTLIERLDSAKVSHWLDQYRLGDVWRIGELGGNP